MREGGAFVEEADVLLIPAGPPLGALVAVQALALGVPVFGPSPSHVIIGSIGRAVSPGLLPSPEDLRNGCESAATASPGTLAADDSTSLLANETVWSSGPATVTVAPRRVGPEDRTPGVCAADTAARSGAALIPCIAAFASSAHLASCTGVSGIEGDGSTDCSPFALLEHSWSGRWKRLRPGIAARRTGRSVSTWPIRLTDHPARGFGNCTPARLQRVRRPATERDCSD